MVTPTIANGATYAPTAQTEKVVAPGEFIFAATHLEHGHIFGQINGLKDAGATLKWVYDPDPKKVAEFLEKHPEATVAKSFDQILSDPKVQMVTSAAIPSDRAEVGFRTMEAGKDYFTDKSPFTTLDQLEAARIKVKETGQRYMVYFGERLHNDAAMKAGELIAEGVIGRVLQVINIAPHRLNKSIRPDWFFQKEKYGGIITDIGSHQFEQFLSYTETENARINFARVANFNNPDNPELEDFGEVSLIAENGASFYCRMDWFTPASSPVWGDGRTFVMGTKGTLEVRKYMDVGRRAPDSLIYLTTDIETRKIECFDAVGFPFFGKLILDCINRTENAMTQTHAFKAAELSMQAQALADQANG
jgi:predicted dehydrogenase